MSVCQWRVSLDVKGTFTVNERGFHFPQTEAFILISTDGNFIHTLKRKKILAHVPSTRLSSLTWLWVLIDSLCFSFWFISANLFISITWFLVTAAINMFDNLVTRFISMSQSLSSSSDSSVGFKALKLVSKSFFAALISTGFPLTLALTFSM